MTSIIPITLQGTNLGERHRFLNSLVLDVNDPFETIRDKEESSPVDRLFKIDVASKHRHVEYILKTLQDEDMLYVSRALKCKWLLDEPYRHIINPDNLEKVLFPHMTTTAVNKTKHWIHLNLRDPKRCEEFYYYYCEKDKSVAIKFLLKCPPEIVKQESPKWFDNIAPNYFKILCERSAVVAKVFFEALECNKQLKKKYFDKKDKFFDGLKCILKTDTELFLDIVEKIKWIFPHLSPRATKFVMTQAKQRFSHKPELYAVNILHMETLAQCLTPEECEELVLKLARAKFLESQFSGWFTYKQVEPLITRVDQTKRALFKKRVFVEKDVGEEVKEWPYPVAITIPGDAGDGDDDDEADVFKDVDDSFERSGRLMQCSMKCSYAYADCYNISRSKEKTLLDVLFDEYRFTSFDETLLELQKKIGAESLPKNRMFMLLVLVSKTGGREESLRQLFQLLMNHRNEPAHIRAAVVRSLVKRTFIWRAAEDVWKFLVVFGEGLGLDGADTASDCEEGLHAVVIRSLLTSDGCSPAVTTAFLKRFSTLATYSLTCSERAVLSCNLVKLLLTSATTASDLYDESKIMINLLDTLKAYNLKVDSEFITKVKVLAAKDMNAAQAVLRRLFQSRICRKELFRENFELYQSPDAYMNALKHNPGILSGEHFVMRVAKGLDAGRFLRRMNVYFGEQQGIRDQFLNVIKEEKPDKKLSRSLVYLIGASLKSHILKLDADDSKEVKVFSAHIRAHAHVARPALPLDCLEWRRLGAKLIANRVLVCRQVDLDPIIKQLLTWKQTAKLAIILAKRTNHESDTLAAAARTRPTVALKTGLSCIRRAGDKYDPRVWELLKPLMVELCNNKSIDCKHYLTIYFNKIDILPLKIRPEFVTLAFTILKKNNAMKATSMLSYVKLVLPHISEEFVESVLLDYLNNEFVMEKMSNKNNDNGYILTSLLHLKILARHLLLCMSEQTQTRRFEHVGLLYLNRLQAFWKPELNDNIFLIYLNGLLTAFKYTEVFLNEEYINCVPVMGKVVMWMQDFLPMEKYFHVFVDVHLTMSYFRAVRQAVKQRPEVFTDRKRRLEEGAGIVGEAFGKYVGREVRELRNKYFDSIIELYGSHMLTYIRSYFNAGIHRMQPSIIRGLLADAQDVECLLPVTLYNNSYGNTKETDEIREIMKQRSDAASQFIFNCVMVQHR